MGHINLKLCWNTCYMYVYIHIFSICFNKYLNWMWGHQVGCWIQFLSHITKKIKRKSIWPCKFSLIVHNLSPPLCERQVSELTFDFIRSTLKLYMLSIIPHFIFLFCFVISLLWSFTHHHSLKYIHFRKKKSFLLNSRVYPFKFNHLFIQVSSIVSYNIKKPKTMLKQVLTSEYTISVMCILVKSWIRVYFNIQIGNWWSVCFGYF